MFSETFIEYNFDSILLPPKFVINYLFDPMDVQSYFMNFDVLLRHIIPYELFIPL